MVGLPDSFHTAYRYAHGTASSPSPPNKRMLRPRRYPRAESAGATSTRLSADTASPSDESPVSDKRKRKRTTDRKATFSPTLFPHVTDHLYPTDKARRLDVLICGLNPGLRSSQRGLHFAHPSNHFYRTLHLGGLTPLVVKPEACAKLVDQEPPFPSLGLTNICCRPTREGSQLSRADFVQGTPVLNAKIAKLARPRLTVFTGKGIGTEWEKCARQVGAISAAEKKPNAVKAKAQSRDLPPKERASPVKADSDASRFGATVVKREHHGSVGSSVQREDSPFESLPPTPQHQTISLPFPSSIPFAPDDPQGLGLMPYVLDLQPAQADNTEPGAPYSRYSFLFLVTSPSGRVTTMHLPEKGAWMGKARQCWEYLERLSREVNIKREDDTKDGHVDGDEDLLMHEFQVVRLTPVSDEPSMSKK